MVTFIIEAGRFRVLGIYPLLRQRRNMYFSQPTGIDDEDSEGFKVQGREDRTPRRISWSITLQDESENGKYCWTMSPEKHVKAAVTNVEEDLARIWKIFPSKYVTPLSSNYAPWMENFPELMADGVQQY